MPWTQADGNDASDEDDEDDDSPVITETRPPYRLEPELQSPPPRKAVRRRGHANPAGCVALFIMPHTLIGIGMIFAFLRNLIVAICISFQSTTVDAKVYDQHTSRTKNGMSYQVSVAYNVQDHEYTQDFGVSSTTYELLKKGRMVQVRISPLFPAAAFPVGFADKSAWGETFVFGGIMLFWCGILSVFWYNILRPLIDKNVVSMGKPVTGRIAAKRTITGKTTEWILDYTYQAPEPNTPRVVPLERKGSQTTQEKEWGTAEVGDEATVLYHPQNPHRSVLYQYCDYQVG